MNGVTRQLLFHQKAAQNSPTGYLPWEKTPLPPTLPQLPLLLKFQIRQTRLPQKRMIPLPKAWIQDRKREYYYKKAKEENYRSRATYKLVQANEKYGFIKRGNVVVDLGAAPGGWIQAARKMTGKNGYVLGVDLKPIDPFTQEYIRTIIADFTEPDIVDQIRSFLPREADVVISDAAPNITGVWEVDHAKQIDLATKALEIAQCVLRPEGNFFVKLFEGEMFNDFS